jgi:hypothetical protein
MSKPRIFPVVALGIALFSVLGLTALGSAPAFATTPTSSLSTTPSATTVGVGTPVTDAATVTLSAGTGPFGSVVFAVYSVPATGSPCPGNTPTGTQVTGRFAGSAATSSVVVTASGAHVYTSGPFSTTGLPLGNYVWAVRYVGGTTGYPSSPSITGYDCEPFTVVAHATTLRVPEFSAGLPILVAMALPALLLLRRRLPSR